MNKTKSLALYDKCRDAWNEWAQGMIAQREALEAAGDWVAGSNRDTWNDATRDWHMAAKADFSEHEFAKDANFKDFQFPGEARFGRATFSGDAGFDSAMFSGYAGFVQTTFKGRTVFDAAKFENEANFNAMRGGASFSLAEVQFHAVPNFIEANFNEAPRLDNLRIEPIYKGDPDLPARWRALKRLAVQGLDHERELVFFKGELRSLRWAELKFWHGAYWLNLAYQILSDYGRSAKRPFLIWIGGIVGFRFAYLGQAGDSRLSCVAGLDNPGWAAFELSLRKALPFFSLDSTEKLNQIYTCLYGVQDTSGFVTKIPELVAGLGLAQSVISAGLIFLILLALRNQFRIK